jgi:hypothetical protein
MVTPCEEVRRCPTLPHPPECSTIGAVSLSFRVRNVTGRFPDAITTVTLSTQPTPTHHPSRAHASMWSYIENHKVDANTIKSLQHADHSSPALDPGNKVLSSHRHISTSQLHTLLCFHIWPINPIICRVPHTPEGARKSHLEAGFPLRCFQRLSIPNVANQPCPWQNNWHTRGPSNPVLSY